MESIIYTLGKISIIIILISLVYFFIKEFKENNKKRRKNVFILMNNHPILINIRNNYPLKSKSGIPPTSTNNADYFENLVERGYLLEDVLIFRKIILKKISELERDNSEKLKINEILKKEKDFREKFSVIYNSFSYQSKKNEILYQDFIRELTNEKDKLDEQTIIEKISKNFNLSFEKSNDVFKELIDPYVGLIYKLKDGIYYTISSNSIRERIIEHSEKILETRFGYRVTYKF